MLLVAAESSVRLVLASLTQDRCSSWSISEVRTAEFVVTSLRPLAMVEWMIMMITILGKKRMYIYG